MVPGWFISELSSGGANTPKGTRLICILAPRSCHGLVMMMMMMMPICQKLKTTHHGSSHIGYISWNLTPSRSISSLSMFIKITSTATSQNFEKPPEVFTWGELQDLCKWVVPSPNRNLWKFLFFTPHSPLYNIRKIKTRQGKHLELLWGEAPLQGWRGGGKAVLCGGRRRRTLFLRSTVSLWEER